MPTTYDGLIFDLDGTLWDSRASIVDVWNEVLSSHKAISKPLTSNDLTATCGMHAEQLREWFLPSFEPDTGRAIIQECFEREQARLQQHGGMLFPYVAKGIELLAQKYSLFIVSNCSHEYLQIFLKQSELGKFISDSESYGRSPTSKAENIADVVLRNALERPVYIGDTEGDENSAALARVPFYHAAYGFGKVKEPLKSFDSFEEVCKFFMAAN